MENPLMDKYAVASYIGGITPRVARELMRTMPCINVAAGKAKAKLRVRQSDLEAWIRQNTMIQSQASSEREPRRKKIVIYADDDNKWLDENGHVLRHRR